MASVKQLRTALLLIDIQKGFEHPSWWGSSRSTPSFEKNIKKLLQGFREHKAAESHAPLVIHVYHRSLAPGSPLNPDKGDGVEFMTAAQPLPDEVVLSKHVNSAFIGTDLEKILREHSIQQLVICGLTTDHCVSTTTRMAANLGWRNELLAPGHVEGGNVILVEDACATHSRGNFDAETMHAAGLASLREEFADVLGTDEVLRLLFERS